MITLIWAQDNQNGIGIDNAMPWNIKEEMQHFRKTTMGHPVVMGRKTFESIGKPLPNRRNIILSTNPDFHPVGVDVYHNFNQLLHDLKVMKQVYIIGGKTIYEQFAKHADQLIISRIDHNYHCNQILNFNFQDFKLVNSETHSEFIIEWWDRK